MPKTKTKTTTQAQKIQSLGFVQTPFGQAEVKITRYPAGGALAVFLEHEFGEPLATFSVNLRPYGVTTAPEAFCAKTYAENADLVQPLLDSGWFEVTDKRAESGFVVAPIWRLREAEKLLPMLH